jgi:hypothetical protein
MDEEERGTVLKFDPAAERKKKLNGKLRGDGSKDSLPLKIVATVIIVAALAFAFYFAR